MLGLLIGYCALFGLVVGSFLNVVIYRVPRRESVVRPRSACPTCGVAIEARDNVPIFSWLCLRGRCRNCRSPISARYPLIEAATACLFAAVAARIGFSWSLPAFLALAAGLVALASTDMEHLILPKRIVYPVLIMVGILLVLAAGITGSWHDLLIAAICAMAWFVVFFALNFASPRLLGFGDVRLAPILGLALGWLGLRYVLLGFFSANLIGAIVAISLIATKRMSRQQQIPYGVFLALGTLFAVLAGPELLQPLQSLRG